MSQAASEYVNLGTLLLRPYAREPTIQTIAIIGAGFSGTLVATNLLQMEHPRALRILLLDRSEAGGGIAYASRPYPYLLNLPVGSMSATSADPLDFMTFVQRDLPLTTAHDFVPRELYGNYLRSKLARADAASPSHVRLIRIQGSATAIEQTPVSFRIRLADGRVLAATTIVLALGNPPPARLPAAESVRGSSRYAEDPWAAPPSFEPGETILIVGTGPTMADVAIAGNQSAGGRAVIHAISRHGLLSTCQTGLRTSDDRVDDALPLTQPPVSIRRLFKLTRALCEEALRHDEDWRGTVSRLSAAAPTLWRDLPECERRRFLRHARPYWDAHRHRLPPPSWSAIQELRTKGTLHVHAGRLIAMEIAGGRFRVRWRARGEHGERMLVVGRVINCTGPEYDLRGTASRLLHSLFVRGLAAPDPLGLGLLTDEFGALRGAAGQAGRDLYYIGPMLCADHWDAVEVRELRAHAEHLSRHLATRRPRRVQTP
ncbi:MAG TPA: FAD/NAD(P)-binding protein [Steroidobacteraceae bacterium]|nr:FAD/NAD(P)-binding protein [Steroidobacteraceae bacterium]